MPNWLWRTICGVVAAIGLLAVAQWANCAFIAAPRAWPLYERHAGTAEGKEIGARPPACAESETKAITVLMALLTTLISLSRGMDDKKPPRR